MQSLTASMVLESQDITRPVTIDIGLVLIIHVDIGFPSSGVIYGYHYATIVRVLLQAMPRIIWVYKTSL